MGIFNRMFSKVKCRLCGKSVTSKDAHVVIEEIPCDCASEYDLPISQDMLLAGEDATYILMAKLGVDLRYLRDIKGNVYVCNNCIQARFFPTTEAYLKELDPENYPNEYRIKVLTELLKNLKGPAQKPVKEVSKREMVEKLTQSKDVERLMDLLTNEDSDIRFEAALALEKVGDTRAVEPLIRALSDKFPSVRWRAALTLGEIGDARAIEPLKQASKDQNPQVREYAAESLAKLGDLRHLENLLRDPEERTRNDAARSLAHTGGLKAVPALLRALKDDRKEVYLAATQGVRWLSESFNKSKNKKELQEALLPAMQYLIKIVEEAQILKGARSYDESVAAAISTLSYIGDLSAIHALEELLAKVQNRIEKEGVVREYVNTGIAAGYISTEDDILNIESAIENIKGREKKI